MPFELQPGEQAFFPAPFVPTETHSLVVTNKRVVRFSDQGPFPVGEIAVDGIEFIGRMTERPFLLGAIVAALIGLLLVIGGGVKVLPPVLHAGDAKKAKPGDPGYVEEIPEREGATKEDEFPDDLYGGAGAAEKAKALKAKAERLKKLQQSFKPGVPDFTADLALGLVMLVGGAGLVFGARALYRRRRYMLFCTAEGQVHRLEVKDEQQQTTVLSAMQTAHQIAKASAKPA